MDTLVKFITVLGEISPGAPATFALRLGPGDVFWPNEKTIPALHEEIRRIQVPQPSRDQLATKIRKSV